MNEHEREQIRAILRSAIDLVESLPEKYRDSAFRVAADYLLKRGTATQEVTGTGTKPASKSMSLVEMLTKVSPKTQVDTIVTICYYLELVEGHGPLTIQEIRDGYTKARRVPGKNLSRDITICIRKGYLMQVGSGKGRKAKFQIAHPGINLVESRLADS